MQACWCKVFSELIHVAQSSGWDFFVTRLSLKSTLIWVWNETQFKAPIVSNISITNVLISFYANLKVTCIQPSAIQDALTTK